MVRTAWQRSARLGHLDAGQHAPLLPRKDFFSTGACPRRRPVGEPFPVHFWMNPELHVTHRLLSAIIRRTGLCANAVVEDDSGRKLSGLAAAGLRGGAHWATTGSAENRPDVLFPRIPIP
jgi:hypothetical protein